MVRRGPRRCRDRLLRRPTSSQEGRDDRLTGEGEYRIGRRRIRGIAAQTVLVGFLVVSANLRKLQAVRADWLKSDSDAERDERYERYDAESRYRDARQARNDRAAPWDNFPQRLRSPKRLPTRNPHRLRRNPMRPTVRSLSSAAKSLTASRTTRQSVAPRSRKISIRVLNSAAKCDQSNSPSLTRGASHARKRKGSRKIGSLFTFLELCKYPRAIMQSTLCARGGT